MSKCWTFIGEDLTEQESLELRNAGYMRARGLILAHESKVALLAERLADDGRMDASEFTKLMKRSAESFLHLQLGSRGRMRA